MAAGNCVSVVGDGGALGYLFHGANVSNLALFKITLANAFSIGTLGCPSFSARTMLPEKSQSSSRAPFFNKAKSSDLAWQPQLALAGGEKKPDPHSAAVI